MRLVSVSLHNFRSYSTQTTVNIGQFTAILGRNDIGKSTLLEALEIFFNNQAPKIEQNDKCVHNESTIVEIACVFDDLPHKLTLDARSVTSLADECLLNADGRLEIVKRYDCKLKTPREEIFARANHPTKGVLVDLLKLKNDALKGRAGEINVDLEGIDQRSNAALRSAIRQAVGDQDRALTLVPLSEEDGRKVWDQLQKELPAFALFQADRPSKDDDPEVADPMKLAIAAAVKEVEADLEQIKMKVQASAMQVATRTLAKLNEMDPSLAQQLTPTFKAEPKWDGFKLSLTGDNEIPINKRGSGVRRLILLNFFRAEVERRRQEAGNKQVIYAVEEPESSQHPDNQILLVKTLMALGEDPQTQVLMTTHVPAIASLVPIDSVRFVKRGEDGVTQVVEGNDQVLAHVAESLGVFPDKRAQVAFFVEGPHDVSFLSKISSLYFASGHCHVDVGSDHRVAFVPTGGGNLKHWVEKKYLQNAGMIEFHVYDRDDQANPKYGGQVAIVNARGSQDVAHLTSRRELENYLHSDCIQAEYLPEYNVNIPIADWSDIPALVAAAVHNSVQGAIPWDQLNAEKRIEKMSRAKKRLNNGAVGRMTIEQLLQVDANGEMLGWLNGIAQRLN